MPNINNLGSVFPDLKVETNKGHLSVYEYMAGSNMMILFSHPNDFTPVCTTELGEAALNQAEFDARGVKLMGLSCNTADDHNAWAKDIAALKGKEPEFPIIADPKRTIAAQLGMLDEDEMDAPGIPATVRKVFFISAADHKTKMILVYPTAVGRSFPEILRCIDALLVAAKYPIATPVNWSKGQDVIIQPTCSDADALAKVGPFKTAELPSGKKYLRYAALPQ